MRRMTKTQQTAVAAGAVAVGAALVNRALRARRRIDFKDKTVLITGARGLALQIARQLGADGARVMLAARDQSELDRNASDEALPTDDAVKRLRAIIRSLP